MERQIWCLWEPSGTLPGYLRPCLRSIERNAGVPVRLLDAKDVEAMAPRMRPDLARKVHRLGQRADYYRSHLLLARGGMWLDVDTVVLRDLNHLFEALDQADLVARWSNGRASVGLLCVPAGSPIMERWVRRQEEALERLRPGEDLPWQELGAPALAAALGDSRVHRIPVESIAPLPWQQAHRFVSSHVRPDAVLCGKPDMVTLYNEMFPDWLRRAPESQVMRSPLLLSRVLRIALGESTIPGERRRFDRVGLVGEGAARHMARLGVGGRRPAADSVIVELVGPPGAGKSTIAGLLVQAMRTEGVPAQRVLADGYRTATGAPLGEARRWVDRVVALVTQPRLARAAARCWRLEGTGPALSWYINLARRNRSLKRLRRLGGVTVVEEGPLAAACLAAATGANRSIDHAVASAVSRPSAIVALTVDPTAAANRIQRRNGILHDRSVDELQRLVAATADALEQLVSDGDAAVYRLDTTHTPPGSAALMIADWMRRMGLLG